MIELKKNDPAKARQYFTDKLQFTTGPMELSKCLKQPNVAVIDVRETEDFAKEHVPGAINMPRERWTNGDGLRKDGINVLYCYSQQCHLAAMAAVEFAGKGYSVIEMEGGFDAWKEYELDTESGTTSASRRKEPVAVGA